MEWMDEFGKRLTTKRLNNCWLTWRPIQIKINLKFEFRSNCVSHNVSIYGCIGMKNTNRYLFVLLQKLGTIDFRPLRSHFYAALIWLAILPLSALYQMFQKSTAFVVNTVATQILMDFKSRLFGKVVTPTFQRTDCFDWSQKWHAKNIPKINKQIITTNSRYYLPSPSISITAIVSIALFFMFV